MSQKIKHMSMDIEGCLRNHKGKKIKFFKDDHGNPLTDNEARMFLADLQAKGHKLFPIGTCEGFDPFGGGCPGHPVKQDQ